MNTTNLPTNLNQFTVYQILSLAKSHDIDAAEFGTRLVKWMGLQAKQAQRTPSEETQMLNLGYVLGVNLTEPAFRKHLCGVLHLEVAA